MPRKQLRRSPHDEAISIVEKFSTENLGGRLEASADCNQCREKLTINLVEGASSMSREKFVGTVRPDISMFDENGNPVRFIEIVDSHSPEENVHDYAVENDIEVVEFHLRAKREFTGRRRNRALDASLTVKARLQELAHGRLLIDAHNILCRRPKCGECRTPLPLRTVTVRTTDCWKCGQHVNVATGDIDEEGLTQDYFTTDEIAFAQENGVTLERRYSATAGGKYLANICTKCDQIQGNWFLYMDPFHDRFMLEKATRQAYGPCEQCATRYCLTHGEYVDYRNTNQCPACLEEAERVMCPNNPDRECFYPQRCEEGGCYFLNREQRQKEELERLERQREQWEQQQQQQREERHQREQKQREQRKNEWAAFQEWFNQQRTKP